MVDVLAPLRAAGLLSATDVAFAELSNCLAREPSDALALASALASAAVQHGDVCVDLAALADTLPEGEGVELPELETWLAALRRSGVVQTASMPVHLPLVLDDNNRLYLGRYWHDEVQLASGLLARMQQRSTAVTAPDRSLLDRLFPPSDSTAQDGPDWQRVAAVVAYRQPLCVITGGPGTGKTRTVARLLAVLQSASDTPLDMALLAPTGKAAARLLTSLRAEAQALASDGLDVSLPDAASTLHRALGYRHGRRDFAHNAENPLQHDVVLVDEASMIDLSLMTHLVNALHPKARLILLGDRDQLASVEAGNVLGDIVGASPPGHYSSAQAAAIAACCDGFTAGAAGGAPAGIADAIVHLQHSYRFDGASGIGVFATAVNSGLVDDAIATVRATQFPDITRTDPDAVPLSERLIHTVLSHFRAVLGADTAQAALARLSDFRVLCALRSGPRGVERINELAEQLLARHGLMRAGQLWYPGRPLLVTRNDAALGLYNGDMGVIWPDENGDPLAWFAGEGGAVRSVAPGRLPAHQTCHAMTVHKTQGSEFLHVMMVLPEPPQPLLSRDLLYTGVTRARSSVELYASEMALQEGVRSQRVRVSGLHEKVWDG